MTESRSPSVTQVGAQSQVVDWVFFNTVGLVLIGVTAFVPAKVTTGWYDQTVYHWKTIQTLAQQLPHADLVNISTATGPFYHLFAALCVRAGKLTMPQAQFAVGLATWIALVSVVLYVLRGTPPWWRRLGTTAVVISPYVLESTLWMLTDAFSLVFSLASIELMLRLRYSPQRWTIVLLGLSNAAAVATRQTAAWLLPVSVVAVLAWVNCRRRAVAIVVTWLPAAIVLAWFFILWNGFTPPMAQAGNAAKPSQIGVSVGFALWAFYAGALALSVFVNFRDFRAAFTHSQKIMMAVAAGGMMAALPAVIWCSDYNYPTRGGGWLWKLVKLGGAVDERSPVLILLAFAGGVILTTIASWIIFENRRAEAWLLVVSVISTLGVSALGANAMPKYREVPLLACLTLALSVLADTRIASVRNSWKPVGAVALIQVVSSAVIVLIPILEWTIAPGSVQAPEWVGGDLVPNSAPVAASIMSAPP